jgi:hypothetical protein
MLKLILAIMISSVSVFAQSNAQLNRDPKTVKFVTADLDNFWAAYDLAAKETDRAKRVAIFQSEYLDKGSAGLKDFIRLRIKSADALVTSIDRLPKYYASIRPSTLQIAKMEKRMRKAFVKFKNIYPDAVFPDVYFLVGIANTGGTTGPSGLLIGAEMYGQTKDTPIDELPEWLRLVLAGVDQLPGIVAHESCHYNQDLPRQETLLAKSLQEGSCDLIGELISGQNINDKLKPYGRANEAAIWRDFSAEIDNPKISNWFYNAATSKDRPGDLGYHVGYLISNAYYNKAKDKRQAVRDILNIKDYRKFHLESGYNGPEKR